MSDQELADSLVALGVGWKSNEPFSVTKGRDYRFQCPHTGRNQWLTPEEFLIDWRVVGALMARCRDLGISILIANVTGKIVLATCQGPIKTPEEYADPSKPREWAGQAQDEIQQRAIIKACVEALP